jgi:hypothetical protein
MFIADTPTSNHKLTATAATTMTDNSHHVVDKSKRTVRHDYHDHANDAPIGGAGGGGGVPASISDTSLNRLTTASAAAATTIVMPPTMMTTTTAPLLTKQQQQQQELIDEAGEEADKKRRGPRGGVAVPFPGMFQFHIQS